VKANWFAINRSIVANALFVKRPLWGWAWVHILTRTSYKTEQVCLTEVYRELSEHFTYSQWRHMVGVFVKEGMLEISETVNLGDKAGHRQMASVLNWSKYQKTAQSEQQSERRASDSASAERNNVQNGENDTSAQSERRANDSASAERAAVSIKKIQQGKKRRRGRRHLTTFRRRVGPRRDAGQPNPRIQEIQNQNTSAASSEVKTLGTRNQRLMALLVLPPQPRRGRGDLAKKPASNQPSARFSGS
jgi:hypothetical protein